MVATIGDRLFGMLILLASLIVLILSNNLIWNILGWFLALYAGATLDQLAMKGSVQNG